MPSTKRVADPAQLAVAPFTTRYLKIAVRNDGRYGSAGYIEFKRIKAFFYGLYGLQIAHPPMVKVGVATPFTATLATGTVNTYTVELWRRLAGSPQLSTD
jgi:hypothetical protein